MELRVLTELYLIKDIFKRFILAFRLFLLLLISSKSADLDGCIKLVNKREVNITFFDIPTIKIYKIEIKKLILWTL